MSWPRFFVAFGVVVAFLGVAYLWNQPGSHIDQTIVLDGVPRPPPPADAAPRDR